VNLWALAVGVLCGLGIFVAVREIVPAPTRLDAALARLDPGQDWVPSAAPRTPRAGPLARRIAAELPWLPVPATDLALLGKDRESWIASKVACGLLGLVFPPMLAALAMLAGTSLPWAFSVIASLVFGAALFFAPDLVTRVNAAERRNDFRHALTSYLDLVALERGAGAGPTEALEAAAEIGDGWAFQRISGALAAARRTGAAPARPGSASSRTWPTSPRWRVTREPRSWKPSPRGPPPCAPRRWPATGPRLGPGARPWWSRSRCSAPGSCCC
jgi:hypothetical protein